LLIGETLKYLRCTISFLLTYIDKRYKVQLPVEARNLFFLKSSRAALGSTQHHFQSVLVVTAGGVKLTTYLDLGPKLRMSGSLPPLPL